MCVHPISHVTFLLLAQPPRIITHPQELKNVQGESANFIIEATGTDPLSYNWQCKPAEEEGGSEDWQPCPAEWCDGTTLIIPKVEKSHTGSYRCVVSNHIGSQTSNPANLSIGENPVYS